MTPVARDMRQIAEALGFTFDGFDGNGHQRFRHPNGAVASIPATPSEYRGLRNVQLLLERLAGRKLPRVNKRRSHKAVRPSGFSIEAAQREQRQRDGLHGKDVDTLTSERADLIARCHRLAQRRGELRAIPPLLARIEAIEHRLLHLHQPVDRFDPFTLARSD